MGLGYLNHVGLPIISRTSKIASKCGTEYSLTFNCKHICQGDLWFVIVLNLTAY